MFSFKEFLLFWVIATAGKTSRKGKDFSKKKIASLVGFGFSQIRKFYNVKAARSAIIAVLKRLSQLFEKAITVVIR